MQLSAIIQYINAVTIPAKLPDVQINWLLTDSRSLSFPAETLFFAIRTARNNGHNYIEELYNQQVRFFVVDEWRAEFETLPEAIFLKVDNSLQALQRLAAVHRQSFNIPIIGITGSNGKTVVKEWLYQLLHNDFCITRSPRSYNSQIGVPLSVWALNENTTLGIFEAGISQLDEMARIQTIIRPTVGVFCNLGDAHQENFASLKQKCEEKLKLFSGVETLIYCSDNKLVEICVSQAKLKAKLFAWGQSSKATLQVLNLIKNEAKTTVSLKYEGQTFDIVIPFTDEASVENALQCVAVMLYFGYDASDIAARILLLESVAMRLEVKEGIRGCLLINDSYNSDLNSLEIALNFAEQQSVAKEMLRTLILSDILQSGQSPDALYKTVAELVKVKNIQHIVGIGEEITAHAHEFDVAKKDFFVSTANFLQSPLIHGFHNEIVLLKGSRKYRFEDISERLELINHETVLEVNLNALIDNLNYFRAKLRLETKVMCMVKAFAYGSGSVEVAQTLQYHRADYLAVAVADEGAELRREGIRVPIVVMNPEKGSFGELFEYTLEPEIYSFRLLNSFIAAAEKLGLTDYPIHLKIDSGMHRLGFEPCDIPRLIERLSCQREVKIRSVFSHLAGADEAKFDNFTHQQLITFTTCADQLSAAFSHRIMRHILNSAGIERFPEYQFDMVRLGIGHYGISALSQSQQREKNQTLKTVCTLKTIILQIKEITAGETVGYSRKGMMRKNSRVAVLPVGYADGFDRRLGNGMGEVLINGKRAKTVGNICMDLCMVDVSDIDACEGDEVEIFGDNITISEIAERLGTISYEILTSISRRVKRVYYQE